MNTLTLSNLLHQNINRKDHRKAIGKDNREFIKDYAIAKPA